MKNIFISLVYALLAAGCVSAPGPVYYTMDNLPAELQKNLPAGDETVFEVEENLTTGYRWTADFEPRQCRVEIIHHGTAVSGMTGVPGRAEIRIRRLADCKTVVTFSYSRSFEPDRPPVKSFKYILY